MSIGLLFIPESPRWLLEHGHREKALKSLLWHRPYGQVEAEQEMKDIQDALENDQKTKSNSSIKDMFNNPVDRRRTVLAILAITLQGASGAMYMIAYGTYFFEMANIGNSFENSCILTAVGVIAILINSAVITHIGRRRVFLMIGMFICGLTQLLTAIVYTAAPGTVSTGRSIVGLSVIYIVGYNVRAVLLKSRPPSFSSLAGGGGETTQVTNDIYFSGNGCDVRVDQWRRASFSTTALVYVRLGHFRCLPRRMARNVHGSVFHQPRVAQLGPQIRVYLGRSLLAWRVSLVTFHASYLGVRRHR